MLSKRFLTPVIAASMFVALVGCGGQTEFRGAQAFAIAGTKPPPPPPPPPKEEAKPPPRVELRDNKIEFKEKIQFVVNKATIQEVSFSLLHDIADVIKKNPQIKKLSIEGHASAEGDPKYNKKLSDDRAKAVMEYMTKKEAIEASKLVAKGWGEEKPIADNNSEEGREKNRRVEFLVTEQDVTQKKVEIDPATGKERVVDTKTDTHKFDSGNPTGAETPTAPGKTDATKPPAKPAGTDKAAPTPKPPVTDKTAPPPPKPAGSAAPPPPKPAGSATPAKPATPAK